MDFRNDQVIFQASEAGFEGFFQESSEPVSPVRPRATVISLSPVHRKIHQQAIDAAESYRRSESLLIDALMEVDRSRVFEKLGYSSLYQYVIQSLRLSESLAYAAITVARKAREVPELRDGIHDGSISVSKARRVVSVINPSNQEDWISKLKTLPSRKLEKEVARVNPKAATSERAHYVTEKRLALSLGVEEATLLEFRRAQDQVSRSQGRAVSLEETLAELLRFYLSRKDPVRVAERVTAKKGGRLVLSVEGESQAQVQPQVQPHGAGGSKDVWQPELVPGRVHPKRAPIPAVVSHAVRLRDQGRCQASLSDGSRCGESRWTDLHHRVPVKKGGPNTPENLVTLCRAHHRAHHRDLIDMVRQGR